MTGDGLFYSNGSILHLRALGGHPGRSVEQGEATDRYVIAAYAVPIEGDYAVTTSSLVAADTDCGDGNVVHVYVNDTLVNTATVGNGTTSTFDIEVGGLAVGDHIYVAVGPGENDFCDSFEWDFTIAAAN